MFEYIKGILTQSSVSHITLETHGIGYCIHVPFNNYTKLSPIGTEITLYVSLIIREDAHKLFGFLTPQEKELFELFIGISGIGPKTALALIGHMEFKELQTAIGRQDVLFLCKVPGIGKKTAERLIVEMRDKIDKILSVAGPSTPPIAEESHTIADAINALINLGYNSSQAQRAVRAAIQTLDKEVELAALITTALRTCFRE